MLKGLIVRAEKEAFRLAPFIGIGCPGMIQPDGSIDRGAQNLPGNWESSRFNLPLRIHDGERSLLLGSAAAAFRSLSERSRHGPKANSRLIRSKMPSRPGEFHHEPLTDPDLRLSRHPARATARRLPPSIEYRVPPVAG